MYEIKNHGGDTLLFKDRKVIALFYSPGGKANAELFVRAKEKAEEIFIKDRRSVPQEW